MNTKPAKILGIALSSVLLFGSIALAEGTGNRGYEGSALDQIGQSRFTLQDDTANDRNTQLPVYNSGSADRETNKVN